MALPLGRSFSFMRSRHREQHHNGSAAIRDSSHGCFSQKNGPNVRGPLWVIGAVLNVNGSLLVHYDKRTFSRLACFTGANGGLKKSSRIIASELSLQLH
jgi:hypothetical protein